MNATNGESATDVRHDNNVVHITYVKTVTHDQHVEIDNNVKLASHVKTLLMLSRLFSKACHQCYYVNIAISHYLRR